MLAQANPEVYEAYDVEYAEEQAQLDALAQEAWAEERAYWQQQQAAESYGDWLAQQVEAAATDEEPAGYDPSDAELIGRR